MISKVAATLDLIIKKGILWCLVNPMNSLITTNRSYFLLYSKSASKPFEITEGYRTRK